MIPTINKIDKDPLGAMMMDYYNGDPMACVEVESATLEMTTMNGVTMFRGYAEMSRLEKYALELCKGKILDIGAGSGCHSLHLQRLGEEVDAVDISPGCVEVMKKRNVANPLHVNVFSLYERKYTTVLMLMNGLGICGTLDRLNLFLQLAKTLIVEGGQIIADSTDLRPLLEQGECFQSEERYYGETDFIMRYGDTISEPFEWLYIDYETLHNMAKFNGWSCEQIMKEQSGEYLVRMCSL